jgi:uridine phosphorylase
LPSKYILTYTPGPLNYFKRKYKGKFKVIEATNRLKIYMIGDVGLIKFGGIGAPHAVTYFEELIAMGGKEFINMGTAGGLQHKGIFLCERAIRDEGTSSHYCAHEKYSYPDRKMTKRLGDSLAKQGMEFERGTTWTIDAPYRETRQEVEHYHKEGVATVEMEASALFAVAQLRKVKIASAFVVSDVLEKKWDPQFHKMDVKKNLNKLVDASISCLKS